MDECTKAKKQKSRKPKEAENDTASNVFCFRLNPVFSKHQLFLHIISVAGGIEGCFLTYLSFLNEFQK